MKLLRGLEDSAEREIIVTSNESLHLSLEGTMDWLDGITAGNAVAQTLLILSIIAVVGLALSAIKVRGIGLGVAGVLFAGLFFGHIGWSADVHVIHFVREFGLILFVFTIGLQIGPGFFASLKKQGLQANLCAAAIVFGAVGVALGLSRLFGVSPMAAAGLFSGATTNTPSLGAAQQAMTTLPGLSAEVMAMPALAYAVAYPGGVFGIILTILLLRKVFNIDPAKELASFEADRLDKGPSVRRINLRVTNENLQGITLTELLEMPRLEIAVSRYRSVDDSTVRVPKMDDRVKCGDVLLAVGREDALERFRVLVGTVADEDLMEVPTRIEYRRLVLTSKTALGKSLQQLALNTIYNVVVTRVIRGGVEMTASPGLKLQFGDRLQVVGDPLALDQASKVLGNSRKVLGHTNFLPIFAGIALGVLAGLIPIALPGLPVPVRLGLAGGPLIVAILLSRIGRIGSVVWYMPEGANLALRELGIVLFLACVGLQAGGKFMDTLLSKDGLAWWGIGLCITMIPIGVVGFFARAILKMNFVNLSGLIAGSMTDPPALAFANLLSKSDAPSVAYASVYPLTMLLRILCAQLLVLVFA